ncbi:heme lyase CcmF/NrfE family subunit [Lacibacterium aquatile]|uniref:Heme lyase CcmF/NrfE family subunit n=1 Tax=Lacibacterium aquatile TaxID=1168082 RepID=A0ABW5E0F7_9PROT
MIVEAGHFVLILAAFITMVQVILPLWGAARGDRFLMAFGTPASIGQAVCCLLAFAALMHAYLTSDFSVVNVVENSHQAKPLLYKISGVWGNHEGSLLLWITVMALFGAAVGLFGRRLPDSLKARVLGIQALVALGFYGFILFTSNPFERVFPPPIEGRGLNPLLQDPGLAFHPPMLYLGYVGFSLTFSFAIAALLERRVDPAWARWVRPWTLAAWAMLTGGIALGSWWAYYELGWGGWWFWDPVENASLMPWLSGTALLHSAIVVEKRDALKRWTILLAVITFAFSLMGTFLVRSGVITSVHAFAVDPTRGSYILILMVLVVGGALALYARRAADLEPGGLFAPISREGALILNNVLLATALATVLLGTLYPMILQALDAGAVSVGTPYYQATFVPLVTPLLLLMAAGPLMAWKRADLRGVLSRLKMAILLTALGLAATWAIKSDGPMMAPLGFALGLWLIFGSLTDIAERINLGSFKPAVILARAGRLPASAIGAALAHAGLGVSVLGMVGTLWQAETIQAVPISGKIDIAGYRLELLDVEAAAGPNYQAARATVKVMRNGKDIAFLHPERRRFASPPMVTTEAAIRTNIISDLYVVLGEAPPGAQTVPLRVYHNPLAPFIWLGALVMVLGAGCSLADRRLRVGAPKRGASALAVGQRA